MDDAKHTESQALQLSVRVDLFNRNKHRHFKSIGLGEKLHPIMDFICSIFDSTEKRIQILMCQWRSFGCHFIHVLKRNLNRTHSFEKPRDGVCIAELMKRKSIHHLLSTVTRSCSNREISPRTNAYFSHSVQAKNKPAAHIYQQWNYSPSKRLQIIQSRAFLGLQLFDECSPLSTDLLHCQKPSPADRRNRTYRLNPSWCGFRLRPVGPWKGRCCESQGNRDLEADYPQVIVFGHEMQTAPILRRAA